MISLFKKGEPYRSSSKRDPKLQTDKTETDIILFFIISSISKISETASWELCFEE